jgi:hypothetical protein
MIRLTRYGFSTVALISGAPRYDQYTASIANTLKKVSNGSTSLVGVIGAAENQSYGKVYASSSLLDNYEFEVTRAYNTYHESFQDAPIMPYRMYTHFCNYKLMKELEKQDFFDDVFANRISAVITVGNFSLSRRIGLKLNQVLSSLCSTLKPTASFDLTPPSSTGREVKGLLLTKSSWTSNTTTCRNLLPTYQDIPSPRSVWDMTDFTKPSSI